MMKEFRTFILRGNVIDLAVGVIIGVAFGSVVTSLVNDILMPPLGYILGDVDFTDLFIVLGGGDYASLAEAQEAGAATINYGVFINAIINFLLVGTALFFLIRTVNRVQAQFAEEEEEAAPAGPSTEEKLADTLDRLATVLEKKE
jgi:large conductance mechanosensitive channel